jgi:hypothetical protein
MFFWGHKLNVWLKKKNEKKMLQFQKSKLDYLIQVY